MVYNMLFKSKYKYIKQVLGLKYECKQNDVKYLKKLN